MVLAPVIKDRKGEHARVLADARQSGFVRVRVDGEIFSLDDSISLEKTKRHTIDIVVDRIILPSDTASDTASTADVPPGQAVDRRVAI